MFKKNELYRIEDGKRIYDSTKGGVFEFTYNEICVNFKQYMNLDTKIFYLKGNSKHSFSLNSSELNYLCTINLRWFEPLIFVFSENIKILKKAQRSDLFLLTNLKDCEFVYLLPRLDVQNKFYFDLVLGVKPCFDINQFYKWNLQSINIINVIEINDFNLDYYFIKKIFNFENCKFRDNSVCKEEYKFLENLEKNENNIKKLTNKNIETIIRRCNYKFIFKGITNHCYWYDGKVVNSSDAKFFIDYDWDTSIVLKKTENGEITSVREYMYVGGLLDVFDYNGDTLNFNSFILNKNL